MLPSWLLKKIMIDTQLYLILLVGFLILQTSIILVAIFFNLKLDQMKQLWRVELRRAAEQLQNLVDKIK